MFIAAEFCEDPGDAAGRDRAASLSTRRWRTVDSPVMAPRSRDDIVTAQVDPHEVQRHVRSARPNQALPTLRTDPTELRKLRDRARIVLDVTESMVISVCHVEDSKPDV